MIPKFSIKEIKQKILQQDLEKVKEQDKRRAKPIPAPLDISDWTYIFVPVVIQILDIPEDPTILKSGVASVVKKFTVPDNYNWIFDGFNYLHPNTITSLTRTVTFGKKGGSFEHGFFYRTLDGTDAREKLTLELNYAISNRPKPNDMGGAPFLSYWENNPGRFVEKNGVVVKVIYEPYPDIHIGYMQDNKLMNPAILQQWKKRWHIKNLPHPLERSKLESYSRSKFYKSKIDLYFQLSKADRLFYYNG